MFHIQLRPMLAFVALALSLGVAMPAPGASSILDDEELATEAEEKEAKPKDRYLVVVGADIHTGTGEVLRDARLLAKNGKIVAIGYDDFQVPGLDYDRDVPPKDRNYELKVLDASNVTHGRIYPGMVAFSSSGLMGGGGDFRDSIDMFNKNMLLALAAGITTTGQTSSTAKLKRYVPNDSSEDYDYDFDGVVIGGKSLSTISWGSSSSKRGLREKLTGAAKYMRAYRQWQVDVKKDKGLKEPSKSGVDSTILGVLRGETLARFSSDYQDDLAGIARIAMEFGFRPVIAGCREGWVVADQLGRAGAMAILTPRTRRSKDERLVSEGGSSIENAAILHSHGVQVAVIPGSRGIDLGGIAGRDIMHLPVEVGFAIRGGLPEDAALASVTTVPARLLGVGHRVGTLEVGKDCDLIVTDGDLLHYQTFVQYTVVDGDVVYDKQDELYFAHIRPRDDSLLAPLVPFDPAEEPLEKEEGDEEEGGDDSGDGDDDEDDEGDEEEKKEDGE